MFANIVLLVYVKILDTVLYSFEYFGYMTIVNSINTLLSLALGYFLCITRGYGSAGIYAALTFAFVFIIACNSYMVFCKLDWKDIIESENGLHTRVKKYQRP